MLTEREEMLAAFRQLRGKPTAAELYALAPSFVDQHALVDELRRMEGEGLLRREPGITGVRPTRYALSGPQSAGQDTPREAPLGAAKSRPSPERGTGEVAARAKRSIPESKAAFHDAPAPDAAPGKETTMPKPRKQSAVDAVLAAITASRYALTHADLVAATKLESRQVTSALSGLKARGEIHVAGYVCGDRRKARFLPGPAAATVKPLVAPPVPASLPAAPVEALPSGGGMRIWVSDMGDMRIEVGAQSVALDEAQALRLQAFLGLLGGRKP